MLPLLDYEVTISLPRNWVKQYKYINLLPAARSGLNSHILQGENKGLRSEDLRWFSDET